MMYRQSNLGLILIFWLLCISIFVGCRQNDAPAAEPTPAEYGQTRAVAAPPDWAKNANIYEVNIRQYTPEGTIIAFAQHLPRLREMGVDILWLMPIYPISEAKRKGTLGSYYAISDYTAVNPNFGTMADFQRLVDSIHALDMRVILDWVPNHTGWDHAWITEHPDWYTQDSAGNVIDPIDPNTGKSWGWTDVADLNYESEGLRQAMTEDMLFWLDSLEVDGFRVDVASEVPDDFWAATMPRLRQANPDIFLLAEAEHPPHRNEGWFAMSYGWSFHHLMNEIARGKAKASAVREWYQKDTAQFQRGYAMMFITNHDENSWNGTEFERMGPAVDAMAVLAFTFSGMPLIYSGQEAAMNKRLEFFEKDAIKWGNYSKADFYATLLDLKHQNQALWNGEAGGEPQFLDLGDPEKVLAYRREKNGQEVVVILNLSKDAQQISLADSGLSGEYEQLFSQGTVDPTKVGTLSLRPWGYAVWTIDN